MGAAILTSIFKSPVTGRVPIRGHNLEGDRQSDLTVHGGPYKAVYAYAVEHYDYWAEQLPGFELSPGMFGENLTTAGLDENVVKIGDRYAFGSAVLQVTQPRMPCYKLTIRFDRDDMIKRFIDSHTSGFYLSVLEEGEVAAGSLIEVVHRDPAGVSVADITRLYYNHGRGESGLLQQAIQLEALPASWRDYLRERAV
jgi:MOSC domain-containing protein YiiM